MKREYGFTSDAARCMRCVILEEKVDCDKAKRDELGCKKEEDDRSEN